MWNAASSAKYYKLYRNGSRVGGNITAISYNDTSATPGLINAYRVRAHNDCGDSSYSSSSGGYRATTSVPTDVSATVGTYCDKVRVTWNGAWNDNYYMVYRDGSRVGGDITGTLYDDTSATPGVTYSYKVRAHDDCGDSSYSGSNSGNRGEGPSAPTGVSASIGTFCDKVGVSWNPVPSTDYYKVYRDGSRVGGDITGTSYDDTSAVSGTTYSYTVKAHNGCGDSSSSGSNSGFADCNPCPEGDDDDDGICNGVDNCPNVANPDQLDCDNDAIGDACDSSPHPDEDCNDGIDNDCDGDTDCSDDDCADDPDCACNEDATCDPGETSCNCAADCGTPPASELLSSTCDDGIDNDCDGDTDCADSDCECENFHPADMSPYCGCASSTCRDNRLDSCEILAYARAWVNGEHNEGIVALRGAFNWKQCDPYVWNPATQNWDADCH